MSNKITVCITADQCIRLSKVAQMEEKDYQAYLSICAGGVSLDELIGEIAAKYDLGANDCDDEDNPENIEFELVK